MTSRRSSIDVFAQPALALVGASRSGHKFGNVILRELLGKGIRVYPLHPAADVIDGTTCYATFKDIPEHVGGVIVSVTERGDVAEEGAATHETVPEPRPDVVVPSDNPPTHPPEVAVQAQPDAVLTLTLPLPPVAGTGACNGDTGARARRGGWRPGRSVAASELAPASEPGSALE